MSARRSRKTDGFLDFVLDQLDGMGGVDVRPMFGGHGITADGVFFAIVFRGRLYFRTDARTRVRYVEAGMLPFKPRPGTTLGTYYEVPAEIVERRGELVEWARDSVRTRG